MKHRRHNNNNNNVSPNDKQDSSSGGEDVERGGPPIIMEKTAVPTASSSSSLRRTTATPRRLPAGRQRIRPGHASHNSNHASSSPRGVGGRRRPRPPMHSNNHNNNNNNGDDWLFRRAIWCIVLSCPISFLLSMFLSAYILDHLDDATKNNNDAHHNSMDPQALSQQFIGKWVPNKVRDMLPSLWWTPEIDMRELNYKLRFDNPNGGVWTQGWDLDPVPIGPSSSSSASSSSLSPLQVFVVPHSHNDPGWLKTFDEYFQTQTKNILTTVVEALTADPRRKFIWAEISYLEWWWREQTPEQQEKLRMLLKNGQFEIVTGGWVMPDEANSQLYALEIQLQEGHDWIRGTLGEEYIPSFAWSIDPFGYSPTMAYLLAKQNFKGMVIQRVHYAVKKELARRQHLEFYWRQVWDTDGEFDIWTHVLPFFSYDVPHSCGPDPSICCQFDFARIPVGKNAARCPWKKPPQVITEANVAERATLLLDQYRRKAALYRSRALLVPLGDDFRFQTPKEAEDQFTNYQRLFDYMNQNFPGVQVQFGTLKDYFQAAEQQHVELPLLKGSFFTYADVGEDYWSGYYTSRVFDKALDRQLERSLYDAEQAGCQKGELREARRALSLFQHHDGVAGTATEQVVYDYAFRMKRAIESTQVSTLRHLMKKYENLFQGVFDNVDTVRPCFLSGSPRSLAQNLCGDNSVVVVFNPLTTPQQCGLLTIPPNEAARVELPCETIGPAKGSKAKLEFDPKTGLLIQPIREEWMNWQVEKGGAYLFSPEKLFRFDEEHLLKPTKGGFNVTSAGWARTVIEQSVPAEYADTVTVIDFLYETQLETDNEEWFVRFSADISNQGYFHTDLNGFNFDTHRFRSDLPIQSQVFPMPTHAAVQDSKLRLTVLSEHSQGTASLRDGAIDVWLDRRLAQDDGKGLRHGVQDNVPTRTRLRVILEKGSFEQVEQSFQVSSLVRRYWEELQHPLEMFGPHVKQLDKASIVADPVNFEQKQIDKRARRHQIRLGNEIPQVDTSQIVHAAKPKGKDPFTDDKQPMRGQNFAVRNAQTHRMEFQSELYPVSEADIPLVYMVYNRLHYFNRSIISLRESDFPRERVPIIISHDGNIPEMVSFVEEIKKDFKIIQLFHPFSCHEHPGTFPGNDENLNKGYKGDKAKHPRTAAVTCAKHHFTWMLNEVFYLNVTTDKGTVNDFAFLEEDYVVGPTLYAALQAGIGVLTRVEDKVPGGLLGLELDPTLAGNRKEPTWAVENWVPMQFATGPMTLGRSIFEKIRQNAELYCTFDDYNWDWSIVKLATDGLIPHAILSPSHMLAKHIGVEGMHTEQLKKIKKKQEDVTLVAWTGHGFRPGPAVKKKKAPGWGGWGHPADHEHCRSLFIRTGNLTHIQEFWEHHRSAAE